MAQPSSNACLRGCLLTAVIAIVVIILIVVIAAAVVLNMTPEKLGIADVPLADGVTLRSMGFADTKIKDIIKALAAMMEEPNEEDIVGNSYDDDAEKSKTQSTMSNSSLSQNSDGSYDYTPILSDKVTYDKEYLKDYNDTTVAYIFDSIVKSNKNADNEAMKFLRDIDACVLEVSLTKNGSKYELRIVVRANMQNYTEDISKEVSSLLPIPERIYIVSYSEVTVDAEGKIVATSTDLRINDTENAVADAIFSILASNLGDKGDANDKNAINNQILSAFADVVYNLGKIGTADVVEGSDEVSGNIELGVVGLRNHGFKVITHVGSAEEVIEEEAA